MTMFRKATLLGLAVLSGAASAAVVASSAVDGRAASSHLRSLKYVWVAPAWYDRLQSEDTTGLMRQCSRRTEAPTNGSLCDFEEKICFFGTQECPGIGPHPMSKCFCDGETKTQRWSCTAETCPEGIIAVGAVAPDATMDGPSADVTSDEPMAEVPAMEAPPLFGDQVDAPFKGDTYTDFPSVSPTAEAKEQDLSGCPIEKTVLCEVDGQKCSWDDIKTMPDGTTCTSTETCTCVQKFFHKCALEMDCVKDEVDDMTDIGVGGNDIGVSPPFKDDSFTDFPSAAPTES